MVKARPHPKVPGGAFEGGGTQKRKPFIGTWSARMGKPISRKLWWLGLLGLLHLVDDSLAWTRFFFLLFLAPLLTDLVRFLRKERRPAQEDADEAERRLPGPAESGGALLFHLRYLLSDFLSVLNPRACHQMYRQMRGEASARRRIGGREPSANAYQQKVEYALPFAGEWMVARGGVTPETSHSWEILSQRYAYDFVIVEPEGRTHRGDGSRLEDYYAYGQPILAPADGEVLEVIDGVRDAPSVGTGWIDWRTPRVGGNSVTVRHAEGEFSYLAHLIPGSIRVRVGQRVLKGDEVGRCGNSGRSTEPHLHFQIQNHPDFYEAVGLPVRFSDVLSAGDKDSQSGYLQTGMRVQAAVSHSR
jgi:murein DD-endopeptidase MepM/ murein hydrolase activator NlpD